MFDLRTECKSCDDKLSVSRLAEAFISKQSWGSPLEILVYIYEYKEVILKEEQT